LALCSVVSGCTYSVQATPTQPPAITQQLLIRSLERALAQLDVKRFAGRPIAAQVYAQSGNADFLREYIVAWLGEQGIRVSWSDPSLTLRVFAPVYGTDLGQTFVGIPAIQTPLFGLAIPEIALFKWVRNRGRAGVQIYAFDPSTSAFVEKSPAAVGNAKFDDF